MRIRIWILIRIKVKNRILIRIKVKRGIRFLSHKSDADSQPLFLRIRPLGVYLALNTAVSGSIPYTKELRTGRCRQLKEVHEDGRKDKQKTSFANP
jgi:hypothetical protein